MEMGFVSLGPSTIPIRLFQLESLKPYKTAAWPWRPLQNPSSSSSSPPLFPIHLYLRAPMALYLLFESASGYALFLAYGLDEIGQNTDAVRKSVLDLARFGKVVKLAAFQPFSSALDALNQCNAVSEG